MFHLLSKRLLFSTRLEVIRLYVLVGAVTLIETLMSLELLWGLERWNLNKLPQCWIFKFNVNGFFHSSLKLFILPVQNVIFAVLKSIFCPWEVNKLLCCDPVDLTLLDWPILLCSNVFISPNTDIYNGDLCIGKIIYSDSNDY